MFKKVAVALATLGLGLGAAAIAAPSQAAPAAAPVVATKALPTPVNHQVEVTTSTTGKTTTKIDGKVVARPTLATGRSYLGWRYNSKNICIWDVQNSSAYDAGWEANTFEAGTSTVVTGYRTSAQGCGDYAVGQVMRILQYSAADNSCSKITGSLATVNYPVNGNYNSAWNNSQYPSAWVNQYYSGCTNNANLRQHAMGNIMGNVMGLDTFYDNSTHAVMNWSTWSLNQGIAGAWADDRNRLYGLMN